MICKIIFKTMCFKIVLSENEINTNWYTQLVPETIKYMFVLFIEQTCPLTASRIS